MKKRPSIGLTDLHSCNPKAIWHYVMSESVGFWAVCAYLIFEYVRPQSIYTWIDFFPWTAVFLLLSFILAFMGEKKDRLSGQRLNKLIVFYGIVVILSALFAEWPGLGLGKLDAYWIWVLAYFAIVGLINTRSRFFVFLLLFLLCNFKMSQHGFLSWAMRGFSFSSWGVTGSPGWFRNSGEFGIQLTIFVPLSIAFVLALKDKWGKLGKWFFYMMPFTAVASVIASSSRGAMLGLVVSAIWALKSSKYFFKGIVSLAVLLALLFFVTPEESKQRFSSSGDDKTSTHRLDRWEKGWDATLQHPLLGVGHFNWKRYYRQHLDVGQKGSALVHNIFVQSMTEHGFIGLFTFIAIILAMFKTNRQTRLIAEKHNWLLEYRVSQGLDIGLVGLLVSSSFITVLYYPYIWMQAALVAALYNSTRLSAKAKKPPFAN